VYSVHNILKKEQRRPLKRSNKACRYLDHVPHPATLAVKSGTAQNAVTLCFQERIAPIFIGQQLVFSWILALQRVEGCRHLLTAARAAR
jgi:hypothetical protein